MSNPLYIDSYDVKPVEMDGTKKNPANSGKNVTGHSVYDKLQEVPSLEESYSQLTFAPSSDFCERCELLVW